MSDGQATVAANAHGLTYNSNLTDIVFEREQDISALTIAQSSLLTQCRADAKASAQSAQKQAQQIIGLSNDLVAQQARYRDFEQKWLPSSKGDQLKVILAAIARYNTTSEQ